MTKEELEQYARENRKRLDAQEVKIGDVVKVLVGQFTGETGIVVGIIACDKSDYTDHYYEIALNCEVPEKYKCRKTLITPNNVAGGFTAHDFEVIGNRAPIQPSNEIKVGDKVRVSKDAPKIYTKDGFNLATKMDFEVVEIEDECARIENADGILTMAYVLPIKYLVKVDAEAKEPKIKFGDRVRNIESGLIGVVDKIVYGNIAWVNGADGKRYHWKSDELELIEPTEQTEAEKKPNVGSIKIPVEVDLTDSYWDAYTGDLAKEVALKVANKFNTPHEAADYAVKVAKSVVEGLKKK